MWSLPLHESFPGGASVLSAAGEARGSILSSHAGQAGHPTAWKNQDFGDEPKSVNQNTKNVAPSPLVQWERAPSASLNDSSLSLLVSASKPQAPPKGLRSPEKKRGAPTVSRAEMFASWIQAHGIQAEAAFQAENVDRAFMGADAEDGMQEGKDNGNGHIVHAGSEEEQRGKTLVWHLQGSEI